MFTTTTVGAHRGAGSGACWIKFGRDLLHRLRRAPRVASRGFRSLGSFIKLFVTSASVVNESRGLRYPCRLSRSVRRFCIDSVTVVLPRIDRICANQARTAWGRRRAVQAGIATGRLATAGCPLCRLPPAVLQLLRVTTALGRRTCLGERKGPDRVVACR